MLDKGALFPALGNQHLNLVARMGGKRFGQEVKIFNLMGKQHQLRNGLVIIKLADKGPENFSRLHGLISPREIGPGAPVLPRTEKEDLNAGLPALLGEAEN